MGSTQFLRPHGWSTRPTGSWRAPSARAMARSTAAPPRAPPLPRAIDCNEADLLPDYAAGTLTVRLHHLANHSSDHAIRHLCGELTATETVFPETNLRFVYKLG